MKRTYCFFFSPIYVGVIYTRICINLYFNNLRRNNTFEKNAVLRMMSLLCRYAILKIIFSWFLVTVYKMMQLDHS